MPNLNEFLQNSQAERLINNEKLEQLKDAPETRKVFELLKQETGGSLEQAAEDASKGDSTQLVRAIKQLMQNPEAAMLISQMKNKLK